jgi:hypothetical protein
MAANTLHWKSAILFGVCSSLFGGGLGFIIYLFEAAVCERELKFWRAVAAYYVNQALSIDLLFGRKWYSWLFYFFIALLILLGWVLQIVIVGFQFRAGFTLSTFSGIFIIIGSLSSTWGLNFSRVSSKLGAFSTGSLYRPLSGSDRVTLKGNEKEELTNDCIPET